MTCSQRNLYAQYKTLILIVHDTCNTLDSWSRPFVNVIAVSLGIT